MTELVLPIAGMLIAAAAIIIPIWISKRPSLEERNKEVDRQLQEICPHLKPIKLPDGDIGFQSTFLYIPMSQSAVCTECGGHSFKAHLEQHYSEDNTQLSAQEVHDMLEAWKKMDQLKEKRNRSWWR